jgi:hypothetical protein
VYKAMLLAARSCFKIVSIYFVGRAVVRHDGECEFEEELICGRILHPKATSSEESQGGVGRKINSQSKLVAT